MKRDHVRNDVLWALFFSGFGIASFLLWEGQRKAASVGCIVLWGWLQTLYRAELRRRQSPRPSAESVTVDPASRASRMRGLVLCGGGGRGAYQLGAMKALAEAGVKFDVVAGSSVGALNGALVLSVGIDRAQLFFREQIGSVFALSVRGILIAMLRILSLEGRHTVVGKSGRGRRAFGFFCLALTMLLLQPSNVASWWQLVSYAMAAATGIPLALSCGAWLACEHWNLAALSERRLSDLIKTAILADSIKTSGIRLIVTVARETEVASESSGGGPRYLPIYIEEIAEEADLHNWLLASASIPFGILPHVRRDEMVFVDGGVVDNAPILPVLEMGCGEVFVIHTRQGGLVNGARIIDTAGLNAHLSRCRLLRALGGTAPTAVHAVQKALVERPLHFNVRVIHICPSEPTGSLLGSLLGSGRSFAERLAALGHRDATSALRGWMDSVCERAVGAAGN